MSSDFDDFLMHEEEEDQGRTEAREHIEEDESIYLDKRIMNCFSLDMISPPNTPPATPIYDTQQRQQLQQQRPLIKKSRRSLVESSKAIEQRMKLREQIELPDPSPTPPPPPPPSLPTKKKRKLVSASSEPSRNILKYLRQSQNAECSNVVVMGKPTKKLLSLEEEYEGEETDYSDVMSITSQLTDKM